MTDQIYTLNMGSPLHQSVLYLSDNKEQLCTTDKHNCLKEDLHVADDYVVFIILTTIIHLMSKISTQAGFSAEGAGGSGLPAEGTCALSRALTQRISQKIVFSVHQGSGGWGPSLLAADLVSRPLPHRSLSASNVKMQRKEAALI